MNKWKIVATLLVLITILSTIFAVVFNSKWASTNFTLNELTFDYKRLEDEHNKLNESHEVLIYKNLELEEYLALREDEYFKLKGRYEALAGNYMELKENHIRLESNYDSLFSDYNALLDVFSQPLSHEVTPTYFELVIWLREDNTNELWYDSPEFICGDFAVMLSQHAKLKNWDMGVVAVWGYHENGESFGHALNAILCIEGLVYIEPQTDDSWYYSNYDEIFAGERWEFPSIDEFIYIERYSKIVWYD